MSRIEKIGNTVRETLDRCEPVAQTLQELYDKYLPTVAARIWRTCCWPHRLGTNWKIGDHRYLVISIVPDPDTTLYVQFWSEPHEQVVIEVCSGEWSPGAVQYLREPQRELLQTLGFEIGGEADNFRKKVTIANVAEAEKVARDTVRILYEAFGFCGQWAVEFESHRGERARPLPVYLSLRVTDLAKLLAAQGITAKTVPDAEGGPVVHLQRGARRFRAKLVGHQAEEAFYSVIILDALTKPVEVASDDALMQVNAHVPGVLVRRHQGPELRVSMLLRLDGGVTAAWIVSSVGYFVRAVQQCEQLLRPARRRRKPATPTTQPTVH